MVVATIIQPQSAPQSRLARPEVLEMVREAIDDRGLSAPRACEQVYAELVDDGYIVDLAVLFAVTGMKSDYAGRSASWRSGRRDARDVESDIEVTDAVPSPSSALVAPPVIERPAVTSIAMAEDEPNAPYDPLTATGAGDHAYRILPNLSGMLAAEWWVGEGRQKPLGHLTTAEVDRLIEHYDGLAKPYLQRVKFLINIRAKMKGRKDEIVADTSPDPGQVKILWDISAP